jgi:hypothetical protein
MTPFTIQNNRKTNLFIFLILLGTVISFHFVTGAVAIILFLITVYLIHRLNQLPQTYLNFLLFVLAGYMIAGRGFAYLGLYPIFIGEIALIFGILTTLSILLRSRKLINTKLPLSPILLLFISLGAIHLLNDVPKYGILAFRDAVIWGYALFAIFLFIVLNQNKRLLYFVPQKFGTFIPYLVVIISIIFIFYQLNFNIIPRWPFGSGINVPIINLKGGDAAVHLAGMLAFVLLGLPTFFNFKINQTNFWIFWGIGFVVLSSTGRAAFLTMITAVLLLGLFQSFRRSLKAVLLILLLFIALDITDIEIDIGTARKISIQQLVQNIQSIFGETASNSLEGSKRWRLMWWNKIINYTLYGEYFWTGKGFGINLADDDGFQVAADKSLRSPHNSHLTYLARMGVPGFVLWGLLQFSFAISLLIYYRRAKKNGKILMANLNLWVFIYWAAFMVNGAFDVFLEGPQGGIGFWCLFGYGLALISYQRSGK